MEKQPYYFDQQLCVETEKRGDLFGLTYLLTGVLAMLRKVYMRLHFLKPY